MSDIDAQLTQGTHAREIDPYARGFLGFSRTDLWIIQQIAQGLDKSEIRTQMGFSAQQTRGHFRQIYRRTGLHDLHQIARWAVENGLDEPVEDREINGQTVEPDDPLERLSPRELQVFAMLVRASAIRKWRHDLS
jgi:DNA-binding CsgD family transcriptional regulator